jgi:hypothetical protein
VRVGGEISTGLRWFGLGQHRRRLTVVAPPPTLCLCDASASSLGFRTGRQSSVETASLLAAHRFNSTATARTGLSPARREVSAPNRCRDVRVSTHQGHLSGVLCSRPLSCKAPCGAEAPHKRPWAEATAEC